jgi:signal transduction histidine kinase
MESVVLTNKQAAFKDLTFTNELAENLPPIHVDKGQIQQSFINLIINAIEATAAGGSIVISTAYKPEHSSIEIAISDTGEGIDEKDLVRIFDPFFTSKENGSGLGLAITHGIIEQHNGTLAVDSKLGRGTRFTITLPLTSGGDDVA